MTDVTIDPPLRWGILSTAAIAAKHVVPALQAAPGHEVVAVGSRDAERAAAWAAEHDIPSSHGSYDELLADPNVEAIYNPLPNHLHVDWSIAALEAGKHVLCEKPLGLDAADAGRLVEAAANHPGLVVMEAFMYRFHPQWIAARQLVQDGRIGELRSIQTFFSYFNDDPANVRNDAAIGGGALLDIGCYPISQARFLFDEEPRRVLGLIDRDPTFGTDRLTSGILDFGKGRSATFTVSTQLRPFQRAQIVGSTGRIEVHIPVNSPKDRPTDLFVDTDAGDEVLSFGPVDQYASQADAFAAAIRSGGSAPTPLDDAIANMAVIDAVFASAAADDWRQVGSLGEVERMSDADPRLPPRWFIRFVWFAHRRLYRWTGGRLGLRHPKPGGWGVLRLTTVGRRTGQDRSVMVGYYVDGPNLVTMAMNGWGEGEPAWWLNLQEHPDARVDLPDGSRLVTGRAAQGEERARLWDRWREIDENLDAYASRRPGETAVVILEPRTAAR